MKNQLVSQIFSEIARILQLKGENPFRIRAYERAAQSIDNLQQDVQELVQKGTLTSIPGIGEDLAAKIKEIVEKGSLKYYEDLKKEIPAGLIEMMQIPGLGPKTVKKLYEELEIDTVSKLKKAAQEGKLHSLTGIRKKTEENILRGINIHEKGTERVPLGVAIKVSDSFLKELKKMREVKTLEAAGSLRRKKDTVRDIDILVTSDRPAEVMQYFINLSGVKEVLSHGETKSSIISKDSNIQIDLRVVEQSSFGSALLYFTGSKEFNIRLRSLAIKMGYKINEYGVFSAKGGSMPGRQASASGGKKDKRISGSSEEEIFSLMKMAYIPPELREDRGEIEAALKNRLPKLIGLGDIKGDFHVHSKYSDGQPSITEIADKAAKLNYEYVGICDHSQSLKVAGGLSKKEVYKKLKEIEELNKKSKVRLLCGTEVDIAGDGSLDYPESILKEFDLVIAAIHSGFKQSKAQLTKRIVNACKNRYANIIAHPTGKLWGVRESYDIDLNEVAKAAADNQVALEINCYPQRLDLNDSNTMFAKKLGVKFALGTDAHQLDQLWTMELGVDVAKRAWLEGNDIINYLSFDKLMKWLKK